MPEPDRPLTEILDTLVGMGTANGKSIIATIRHHLEKNPNRFSEIMPDYVLKRRPMNSKERGKIMIQASVDQRQREAKERNAPVLAFINKARRDNPDITLRELAALLDGSEFKPSRARLWSAATVNNILKSDDNEPTET